MPAATTTVFLMYSSIATAIMKSWRPTTFGELCRALSIVGLHGSKRTSMTAMVYRNSTGGLPYDALQPSCKWELRANISAVQKTERRSDDKAYAELKPPWRLDRSVVCAALTPFSAVNTRYSPCVELLSHHEPVWFCRRVDNDRCDDVTAQLCDVKFIRRNGAICNACSEHNTQTKQPTVLLDFLLNICFKERPQLDRLPDR